ncbi:hypothetical protein FSP39_005132 [Pinctada imbricata]|uniref:Uncharacterized protein n=1 Tax=Pinctada imbricata TaxID=66713 RepID=A0AA88XVI1_PINIB|nr:hypothetical protein FSP39_005132 [Pinctada imbricata]
MLYICDIVLVSVFIYPTVVVFWRGAWTTMDLLLPSYTPTSIIYTVVIFFSSELLYIILSYPILNLFKKIQNHRTLTICIDNALTLYLGVTCVAGWRCIWKTVTFYYLPNHPQIASWSAHGIGYIVLTASLVGNALLARGCKVDGRPIEDGTGLYMTSIIEQLVSHCKRTATDDREIKPESITYI